MRNSIIEASTYTTKSIHVCFLPCFLLHLFLLIFALIVIACYFFVVKMFIISYCCHCWFLSVNVVHWLILLCYIKWSDITCYLILQFIIVLIYNISWIIKWFVVFRNVFKNNNFFMCFHMVHTGSQRVRLVYVGSCWFSTNYPHPKSVVEQLLSLNSFKKDSKGVKCLCKDSYIKLWKIILLIYKYISLYLDVISMHWSKLSMRI